MITVDIVSPLGGNVGGVENVIYDWTRHIDGDLVNLRVFHCYKGGAYLKGYKKQYSINKDYEKPDYDYLVEAYSTFIKKYSAPDVCIATNWPLMSKACSAVREELGLRSMRIVSWIHSTLSVYSERGFGGTEDLLLADAHFTINRETADEIHKADPLATVYEIGNPVNLPPLEENPINPYMLTYVGRLDIYKQIDIILEAMYRAKGPWRLRVIGDGDIRPDVEGWVELLKLTDKVEMLGWQENPWECCKDSGILVMSSSYEGFPMTAIEASARGKTVISTPVNGVKDYVKEGENGYLYPFSDAEALSKILDEIETGEKHRCDPERCRASVASFSEGNYYDKVFSALGEISRDPDICRRRLSVIVPCYNREVTIKKCVESLLAMPLPHYRYELIFVDDASTDSTVDILKEYEVIYPETIMIVELTENSGGCPGNVRNVGMEYASGEYIMFVDSDDYVDADTVIKMLDHAEAETVDVCSSGIRLVSQETLYGENKKPDNIFMTEDETSLIKLLRFEGDQGTACGKLFRRGFLEENKIAFPWDRHVSEDTCFSMKCVLSSKKYMTTSDIFYYYENNESGTWLKRQDPARIMECLDTQKELNPLYEKKLISHRKIIGWYMFSAIGLIKSRLAHMGDDAYFNARLPEIRNMLKEYKIIIKDNSIITSREDEDNLALYNELVKQE